MNTGIKWSEWLIYCKKVRNFLLLFFVYVTDYYG